MQQALAREYGPIGEVRLIHNAAAVSAAPDTSKHPVVLSAGRLWDPAKNIALLDDAAPAVGWPIRVAGAVREPGASNPRTFRNVSVLGLLPQDALAAEMRRAAIFALPALYEPFGLGILEAAAQRCALVLGDIPSLRELWDGCAEFVDPRDSNALAKRLNELIGDGPRRRALGERARGRAQSFGLERMGNAYLQMYASLCARNTRPRAQELCA
jgi:glycogen(starch) synthase